jgi:hypothetical protein
MKARWLKRTLRFTVGMFMILTAIFAVLLAWVVNGAREQAKTVKAIEAAGGEAIYPSQLSGRRAATAWRPPKRLVDWLGADAFEDVVKVVFDPRDILEEGNEAKPLDEPLLQRIGGLRRLRSLILCDSEAINDGSLALLRSLGDLEELEIWTLSIKGPGLRHLQGLSSLRWLRIETAVGDGDLQGIAGLKKLERLWFDGANLTDRGMEHLEGLTNLRTLSFEGENGSKATSAGLTRLSRMKKLESLSGDGDGICTLEPLAALSSLRDLRLGARNVDSVRGLENLVNLDHITLDHSKLTDKGILGLSRLQRLRELWISGTLVTDVGMEEIARLPKLESLFVSETAVGDAGVEMLSRCESLTCLDLSSTRITDACVESLMKLPKLETVHHHQTAVTAAGAARIAAMLARNQARPGVSNPSRSVTFGEPERGRSAALRLREAGCRQTSRFRRSMNVVEEKVSLELTAAFEPSASQLNGR